MAAVPFQSQSLPGAVAAAGRPLQPDESMVEVRCSAVLFSRSQVLLLQRQSPKEWVLPGGRPRPGESLKSCVRREVLEETGIEVVPGRCAYVLEVAPPPPGSRVVELVFLATTDQGDGPLSGGEPGRTPTWVPVSSLPSLRLRPPIAGHVRSLARDQRAGGAYLGNVWRPNRGDGADE